MQEIFRQCGNVPLRDSDRNRRPKVEFGHHSVCEININYTFVTGISRLLSSIVGGEAKQSQAIYTNVRLFALLRHNFVRSVDEKNSLDRTVLKRAHHALFDGEEL